MDQLIQWFTSRGGTVDIEHFGLAEFPGQGWGAIAPKDIPEGRVLFSIPRTLTLSTRSCALPDLFGRDQWTSFQLHKGWAGLILCMMWEESRAEQSQWFQYLVSLPSDFETPMFWSDEELAELRGTSVVGKIGRSDAENDYHAKVVPAVQSRPDLFLPEHLNQWYTLERYHIMGSRILSRSFQVEKWDPPANDEGGNGAPQVEMDVDGDHTNSTEPDKEHSDGVEEERDGDSDDGDDEGDDDDDAGDVAMVPMADMLNARFGCNNARLFYERRELKMVTTKPIVAGDQIWNTYGELPNSELLRRYGHVDVFDLPGDVQGNPGDVVEVPANVFVSPVIGMSPKGVTAEVLQERIDWWLEESGDDTFVVEAEDIEIPPPLISFARLLLLSPKDWEKKKKLPKPKLGEEDGTSVLEVISQGLLRRLAGYPSSIESDWELLLEPDLPPRRRNAIIVRAGEKRILVQVIDKACQLQASRVIESRKRKQSGQTGSRSKKSKQ